MKHKKLLNSLATNSHNPILNSTFLKRFLMRFLKLTFLFCYLIFFTQNKAVSHVNAPNEKNENIIVIEEFMKKLEFKQIKIHSSGKYISYIHEEDGVANIYIAELSQNNLQSIYNGQPAGVKVTNKQDISIKSQSWFSNDIVYVSDKNGSENTSITLIENAFKYAVLKKNSLKESKISLGEHTKNFILLQDKNSILFASNFRKKDKMDLYVWRKNIQEENIHKKNQLIKTANNVDSFSTKRISNSEHLTSNSIQKRSYTNKAKIVFVNSGNFYAFWASANMSHIILQRINSRTNENEFYIYNIEKALRRNMPHNQLRKIKITGEMMLCDNNYVYTYCDCGNRGYIVKTHLRNTLKTPKNKNHNRKAKNSQRECAKNTTIQSQNIIDQNTPLQILLPEGIRQKNIVFHQKNKQSGVDKVIFLNGQMLGVSTYYAKQKWYTKGFAKKIQNCIEKYAKQNNMSDIEWNVLSGNADKTSFICTINSSNVAPEYYLVQLGDYTSKSKDSSKNGPKNLQKNESNDKNNYESSKKSHKTESRQNKINKKLISKNHKITQITKTFNKEYSFFKTEAFTFQSPDGLKILCYLTKPETKKTTMTKLEPTMKTITKTTKPITTTITNKYKSPTIQNNQDNENKFPLIVLVHGGPEMRDYMRFCRLTQFFANLGYGVLKVNYRGSAGFGNTFKFAGYGEWAEKSYYDVLNAVKHLKNQGLISKACIMGASYGGYQALVGSWKNSDVFSCGISICGPSDIKTLIKSIPPYWIGLRGHLLKLIFNVKSMKGLETNAKILRTYKKQINAKSPLNKKISIPMMIVQGKNDVRVREIHSKMMFNKLKKRKIPVTYILFNNEGHSIHHSENIYYMMMCIDKFLKQNRMLECEVLATEIQDKDKDKNQKENYTIKKHSKNRVKFVLRSNTKPKDIIVLEKLGS